MAQPAAPVTIFAAASLTDSLKAVADAYKARTGISITLSFGASSTLARQIDQGARADIFMSADSDWMDYLQKNDRIAPETRTDLLGNRLVLIAARDAGPGAENRTTL
jgi:molybdate transport system substrate-binding protein